MDDFGSLKKSACLGRISNHQHTFLDIEFAIEDCFERHFEVMYV